ncbi:uncharacterized protein EDB91DRAFT_1191622 [Suillus paluster]|uniref:uncharacterized protein n=1 Tax=Suillus paluster TaxID=48578 RepID=UPI001B86E204|nr:uncharacterized protein EDB91DRAFT_1191622 [Suillus paluster]KAG1717364.1 hypothetical protein EDB91DRAFT_1191622 [Suillus paluster]
MLLTHIQESPVLQTYDNNLARDLHVLEAHLLHYQSLLHDFEVSVTFIEETPNPAMESSVFSDEQRVEGNELMRKECRNLLIEIDRLGRRQTMLSNRLKNAMNLAFAIVNIEDSRHMHSLAQATITDSAKQISYLTMVFLPASFIAVSIHRGLYAEPT